MLPILPLQLTYRLERSAQLPDYPDSLWRSALGANLRRHACIAGCRRACRLPRRCAYGYLFETPRPQAGDQLSSQYSEQPHPYVLSPRHAGGKWACGESLAVGLILIGTAHSHLANLLAASRNLRLRRAPIKLEHIELCRPGLSAEPQSVTAGAALDAQPQKPEQPPAPAAVRLYFEHPLRLRKDNRYLRPDSFDFAPFFTSLMRRISMLAATVSEEGGLQADFAALADQARGINLSNPSLHWFDWHRYSARQKKRIPMGGITGQVDLAGDLAPLWPWLWIGQWLHVGKGAAMGLGRYRLEALA